VQALADDIFSLIDVLRRQEFRQLLRHLAKGHSADTRPQLAHKESLSVTAHFGYSACSAGREQTERIDCSKSSTFQGPRGFADWRFLNELVDQLICVKPMIEELSPHFAQMILGHVDQIMRTHLHLLLEPLGSEISGIAFELFESSTGLETIHSLVRLMSNPDFSKLMKALQSGKGFKAVEKLACIHLQPILLFQVAPKVTFL